MIDYLHVAGEEVFVFVSKRDGSYQQSSFDSYVELTLLWVGGEEWESLNICLNNTRVLLKRCIGIKR